MLKTRFLYVGSVVALLVTEQNLHATDVFIEAKAGYFGPTSEKFRNIYGGGGIYGVELSCQTWKNLYAWTSASCFHKSGESIGEAGGSSTQITLVPVALGLKYLFPYKCVDFYLGLAPTFTYVHFNNDSPFVIRHSSKWGFGGIAKAGALFNFKKHFFLDLFGDYSYLKVQFHDTNGGRVLRPNIDLSGWSAGAGIGVRWGRPTRSRDKQRNKPEAYPSQPETQSSKSKSNFEKWQESKKRPSS